MFFNSSETETNNSIPLPNECGPFIHDPDENNENNENNSDLFKEEYDYLSLIQPTGNIDIK